MSVGWEFESLAHTDRLFSSVFMWVLKADQLAVTPSHSSKTVMQESKKRLLANSVKTICQRIDILPHMAMSLFFSVFPTLASGASIARGRPPPFGGAHLAPSLRSRWDRIGQKPEPTFHWKEKYIGQIAIRNNISSRNPGRKKGNGWAHEGSRLTIDASLHFGHVYERENHCQLRSPRAESGASLSG